MRATRVSSTRVAAEIVGGISVRIAVNLNAIEPGDPIGTPVGTASVVNSEDASHAFALVTNPSGLFQIDGVTGAITLASVAVAGVFEIEIQATGSPSTDVLTRRITVSILAPFVESSSILPHILLNQQQLGITL